MTEFKHTPGPWHFEGREDNIHVWSSETNRICFMTSDGPTVANARLIAAAPEMLEALKELVEALEGDERASAFGLRASHIIALGSGTMAIAKAEGRSNG